VQQNSRKKRHPRLPSSKIENRKSKIFIAGAGWITPLGAGLDEAWQAILAGAPPPLRQLPGPPGRKPHFAACIPPGLLDAVARHPRLRRSSNISLYAAAAALAALRDAGLDPAAPGNCALVFAASDGGVIYTRKFYDQVVREGSGSPLLFPETVYNAPGSHIAALLGLDGITYTLVGDASAGLSAVALGMQLIQSGQADHCLVSGAEEADWVLCEAYRQWRLSTPSGLLRIGSNRGALIADGAAAIVLGRQGQCRIEAVSDGVPFFRQSEARASLLTALRQLPPASPSRVISSANGTFVDRAERSAVEAVFGSIPTIIPKASLGDAFGAGALMQIICAIRALRREPTGPILVPVIGLNQQAAAALISGP
jgi:3-oxoacyl-(acyl-carrier-protein) synthase